METCEHYLFKLIAEDLIRHLNVFQKLGPDEQCSTIMEFERETYQGLISISGQPDESLFARTRENLSTAAEFKKRNAEDEVRQKHIVCMRLHSKNETGEIEVRIEIKKED